MGGGDLVQYVEANEDPVARILKAKSIGRQLLSAVSYCHGRNRIHGGVAPYNVFFDKDLENVKLINFGIPPVVEDEQGQLAGGSLWNGNSYLSPEQFEGKLSLKSDTWSFGCLLLFASTGLRPYHDISDQVELLKVTELLKATPLHYLMTSEDPTPAVLQAQKIINQNPSLRCLLFKCFNFNWASRISAKEMIKDKFFKDAK